MSKIINNPIMKGVSGMLGDVVVFREYRGTTIMSNRPKKSGVLTPQQEVSKSNFMRAVNYAKKQVADPITKAEYQPSSQSKMSSAYTAALTDYLTAPTIHEIDVAWYNGAIGDSIVMRASDDFKVMSVDVTILLPNGALAEQGAAILIPDSVDQYEYKATTAQMKAAGMKVIVTVKDKPGNTTLKEIVF
jgi:signal peptidase I